MYKGLLKEIKDRQEKRIEHYKNNRPVDVGRKCLQIDDIDALLSETAKLTAENERLRECLREIDKYEHPGNRDPLTKAILTIKTIKGFARNRLTFKDETQAQGNTKDGE